MASNHLKSVLFMLMILNCWQKCKGLTCKEQVEQHSSTSSLIADSGFLLNILAVYFSIPH